MNIAEGGYGALPNYLVAGPVTVSCLGCFPYVTPNPIQVDTHGKQPRVIHFQGDGSVAEITNIVIHDPAGHFSGLQQLGPKTWRVIDDCQQDGPYKYDITVIPQDCDDEVTLDPIINNQDGGR